MWGSVMIEWGVLALRAGPKRQSVTINCLIDYGIEIYRPIVHVNYVHHGRILSRQLPVFFNYVFVHFELTDSALWHRITALPGVAGIIGGSTPSMVRDAEVSTIQTTIDAILEQLSRPMARFSPGDKVSAPVGMQGDYQSGDGVMALVNFALLGRNFLLRVPEALCDPAVDRGRSGRRNRRRHWRRESQFPPSGLLPPRPKRLKH